MSGLKSTRKKAVSQEKMKNFIDKWCLNKQLQVSSFQLKNSLKPSTQIKAEAVSEATEAFEMLLSSSLLLTLSTPALLHDVMVKYSSFYPQAFS